MTAPAGLLSPRQYARVCGILYLYVIAAGSFAETIRSKLVSADAATTAGKIVANESLFRLAFSGELLHLACDVAIAVILYALFRPVDRSVALLAAFMRLACDVILAVASLSHFATLRLLRGGEYLERLQPDQLQALALLAMKLHGDAYAIGLLFFAFACLSLGYLIRRSSHVPAILGGLVAIAGSCYLANSVAHFLAPAFAATLFPAILVPAFVAELSLALWLVVKGVDASRWQRTASAPAT